MKVARESSDESALTVGDLFCGAGGFAEGFAQAGFRISWAVDAWGPAVTTFQKNHPNAQVLKGDLLTLSPESLEPVDVLVGSPPCVHFSLANRGGNGDRAAGLRLVRRFLSFVGALQPKYWVMENVPNLLPLVKRELAPDGLISVGAGKRLPIPVLEILDAASFGTPQHRRRMFSGSFPIPSPTHGPGLSSYVPLKRILATLPNPTMETARSNTLIRDPAYPELKISLGSLRDHFEDRRWKLSSYDRERARQQKERHFVYGRMIYPDDTERPSRTITATRTRGSRSTIVIRTQKRSVRTLTLREAACAQGFPISYQFWASSMSDKDQLAGNAVPPLMARAIANAIRLKEGLKLVDPPSLVANPELPEPLSVAFRKVHRFSPRRRYRGVVPIDWRHDHRVELDNQFPRVSGQGREMMSASLPRWKARLYLGYAKLYKGYEVDIATALALARALVDSSSVNVAPSDIRRVLVSVLRGCRNSVPDGSRLQDRWTERNRMGWGPNDICDWLGRLVEVRLPSARWAGHLVPIEETSEILERARFASGTAVDETQPLSASVRLLIAAITLGVACEGLNSGLQALERLSEAVGRGDAGFVRFLQGEERSSMIGQAELNARNRTLLARGL